MNHENSKMQQYSLFLIDPRKRECYVHRESLGIVLPVLGISPYTRPAAEVTETVRHNLGLETVVIDWLPSVEGAPASAILEVLSSGYPTDESIEPIAIDALTDSAVPSAALSEIYRRLNGTYSDSNPFGQFGWLAEAERWLRETLDCNPFAIRGVQQLNASGTFALIRFELTTGSAYWLKATGGPNAHEFGITGYLARHHHSSLPPIVAMRSDWNAWLMEEFGQSLHYTNTFDDFKGAATALATLQKQTVGTSEQMLAAGFGDHRAQLLDGHIDDLVLYLQHAMLMQTSTKVRPLSSSRINELGVSLHRACEAVDRLNIPDCAMHGDISPGSVLRLGNRYVFTDWCEGYVGNPFITFEQLCVHAERIGGGLSAWRNNLRGVYGALWKDVLSEHQISRALSLAPLLSLLSYLYGRGAWLLTSQRDLPEVLSYSRSLARHMDRLLRDQSLQEAL